MFKPQPYDPAIARRWLILCVLLGLLLSVVTIMVAADHLTPWLLYPCFIWFLLGILGALLYVLGGVLVIGTQPTEDHDEESETQHTD